MEDNLEIYFCEICSESIPADELSDSKAMSIKGKVIGSCCLSAIRPELEPVLAKPVVSSSSIGLTAVGAVVLAGVAAATLFLDARLTKDVGGVRADMRKVRDTVSAQGSMWAELDLRMDKTLQQGALTPIETRVGDVGVAIDASEKRLASRFEGLGLRLNAFEDEYKKLTDGQSSIQRDVKDVQLEVVRLGRELATAAAKPRNAPPLDARNLGSAVVAAPAKAAPKGDPVVALPANLAEQAARLKDADAGTRFEAVDQLVQSKNPATLSYLVPMLKDGDPFVRRLTAEGLATFKVAAGVDALLVTLADPESIVRHTAHTSLKKLTGQSIAFDPDGSSSSRSSAQRRWKDWWSKNRDKF